MVIKYLNEMSYHFSVENLVGLTTSAVSPGVTLDTSAPTLGIINVGSPHSHTHYISQSSFAVYWYGVDDPESGIKSYYVAVGSEGQTEDIMPYKVFHTNNANLENLGLMDGHFYFIHLKVCLINYFLSHENLLLFLFLINSIKHGIMISLCKILTFTLHECRSGGLISGCEQCRVNKNDHFTTHTF